MDASPFHGRTGEAFRKGVIAKKARDFDPIGNQVTRSKNNGGNDNEKKTVWYLEMHPDGNLHGDFDCGVC